MSDRIPTESRIFADRYLRETRRLEKVHAARLAPGTTDWGDALHGLSRAPQQDRQPDQACRGAAAGRWTI